jgi:hypothetical protein
MTAETLPKSGDYVCINTDAGLKVRVVERRVKHPHTGERCLLCAGELFLLSQCSPLGWTPCGGMAVGLDMPWHSAHGLQGTITRVYSLKGMPLADVMVPGHRQCIDAQITWLRPVEDGDHAS